MVLLYLSWKSKYVPMLCIPYTEFGVFPQHLQLSFCKRITHSGGGHVSKIRLYAQYLLRCVAALEPVGEFCNVKLSID